MPYTIKKEGGFYVVKKSRSSKVFGKHSTKRAAQRQKAAMTIAEMRRRS